MTSVMGTFNIASDTPITYKSTYMKHLNRPQRKMHSANGPQELNKTLDL